MIRRAALLAGLALTAVSPAALVVDDAPTRHPTGSSTTTPATANRVSLYEDGAGTILGWQFCSPHALCDNATGPMGSDGRWHECGLVTEHGVTEHLDAYAARCGG